MCPPPSPPPRALPFPAAPTRALPPRCFGRGRGWRASLGLRAPHRPPRLGPLAPAPPPPPPPPQGSGLPAASTWLPRGQGRPGLPAPSPAVGPPRVPTAAPRPSPASQPGLRFAPVAGAAEGSPGRGVCVMGRGLGNGGAAWEGLAGAPLSPNRTRPRIPATAAPPASSPSPISSRAPGTYPSIAEPDKASLPRTEPRSQRATRAARKWRPGPDGNCRRCRSARGSARRRKEPSARAPGGGGRRAAGHRDRGSGRLRRWLPPPARPPARALAPALGDVPAAVAGWLVG